MVSKMLITGGAGYLGNCFVQHVMETTNHSVVVLDNFSRGRYNFLGPLALKYPNRIAFAPVDIRDALQVGDVFQKHVISEVVHLAAIVDAFSTNREGKDRECTIVNRDAAIALAEIAKKKGVQKFVHLSSVSIYSQGENLSEDAPKQPLSTYGKAKFESEELLKLADDKFKVVAFRPATFVGWSSGFATQTIINLACARGFYNVPLQVFDVALENNKSYLHIKDFSEGILFALNNMEKVSGKAFNISSFNTNMKRVLEIIRSELKRDVPIELVKTSGVSQQVYTVSSKNFESLGFKPKRTVEDAIKETLAHLPQVYA